MTTKKTEADEAKKAQENAEFGDDLTPSEVPLSTEEQHFVPGSPETGTKEEVKETDPVSLTTDDPNTNPTVAQTKAVEQREADARKEQEAAAKAAEKEANKK